MAEVLIQFPDLVRNARGAVFAAQVCGAPNDRGLWEGWIEFLPAAGGAAVRTARETTQPNRADAAYWASGLTPAYLEGALNRALNPNALHPAPDAKPFFEGPAPR